MRIRRLLLVVLLGCAALAAPLLAQTQPSIDDYDVLLVPLFFFGPGAHGSQWESAVSVATTGETTATLPVPLFGDLASSDCNVSPLDDRVHPDTIRTVCPQYQSTSGLLLYTPKNEVDPLAIHVRSRIRDTSRQSASAGVEIPVVRERDFRSQSFLLLDIPSDARFRSNLRIYGGMSNTGSDRMVNPRGAEVEVVIFDSRDLGVPLVHTHLQLSAPRTSEASPYFLYPGHLTIGDLVTAYPQLAAVPSYTIRITPAQLLVSPPREDSVWAFVSVTNNDTQEVTLVTP